MAHASIQSFNLTPSLILDRDYLNILLEETEPMKGTIRCKGKCPKCEGMFQHIKKVGYICPACRTTPNRFYIDLWHDGKRVRLFSDNTGQVLDTYQRAQTLLSHIRYEIQHHTFDPSKYIKSETREYWATTLLDKFLTFKLDSIAPSYKKDYKRMTEIVRQFFDTRDVREIRKVDVNNFKNHIEKSFKFKGKTVKNILDFFKTFLRYLKYDLEIVDNIPSFPDVEVQPYNFKWLSSEEQIKLLNYVPEPHRPIITFLILQGCRPGEARALRCKDVSLRDSTITISATFSKGVYREKRKGRGAKSYGIPIHSEMMGFFAERVKNNLPEAYIFINPNTGRCYAETTLKRVWHEIRERAGILKSFRLYDASRHSFGSQLVDKGANPYKVSKLMGHSSMRTTEKYYLHNDIETLRTDLERLSLKDVATVTGLSPDNKDVRKT